MEHIITTHENETLARKKYAEVKGGIAVADGDTEQAAKNLLAVMVDIDRMKLEASRLTGILMNAMGGNDMLKDGSGKIICTWKAGGKTKKVDYAGIMKKYNVTDEDIAAFTKVSVGARRFSLAMEG